MASELARLKGVLLTELARREEELVELCREIIRIPSENPPGDTTAIADFVEAHLSRGRIEVTRYPAHQPDRPNLLALVSMGRADGPRLLLNAHLDEFPITPGAWTHPPFSGQLVDGRIYGRGACDMRAGLAVTLLVSRMLRNLDLNVPGQLVATFSSDEEAGGAGTRWLLANAPECRGDACLIGDQCGTWAVGIGEKGGCWVRLRTRGRASHAAYGTTESAVPPMLQALSLIAGLEGRTVEPPQVLRLLLEQQRPLVAAEGGRHSPAILDQVTVNVGRISGGTSINLVAADCGAELDIRLPIGLTTDELITEMKARLQTTGLHDVEIEVLTTFEPTWTDPDHPLVRAVRQNAETERGEPPLPLVRLGATDARWFRAAGIPTVVYGPTAHNMGGVDEYVSVPDLLTVARVHAGAIVDYLGGRS